MNEETVEVLAKATNELPHLSRQFREMRGELAELTKAIQILTVVLREKSL